MFFIDFERFIFQANFLLKKNLLIRFKAEASPVEHILSSAVESVAEISADNQLESKPDVNLDPTNMSDTTESEAEKQGCEFIHL